MRWVVQSKGNSVGWSLGKYSGFQELNSNERATSKLCRAWSVDKNNWLLVVHKKPI